MAVINNLEKNYYPSMSGILLGSVGVKISVTAIVSSIPLSHVSNLAWCRVTSHSVAS